MSADWEKTITADPTAGAPTADWEHTAIDDVSAVPEPGYLSAIGRGGLQGASFGLSDEIIGALEAGGRKLGGNTADLSALYEKARDESRAANKATEEAYPWTYGAANIAGGIAPVALTAGAGGAASLGKLIATGAASGGLSALGNSEKEGGELAKDVGVSALIGAGAAPLLSKAADVLKPGLEKMGAGLAGIPEALKDTKGYKAISQAYEQGTKGRRLFGESAQKSLGKELLASEKEAGDVVQQALSEAGKNKVDLLTKEGNKVNLEKWYDDFQKMAENLKQSRGQDPQVVSDIEKIKNIVERSIKGDETSGLAGKGLSQSSEAAESLRTLLGSRGSVGDKNSLLQTNEGSQLINRLVSPLKHDKGLTERSLGIPEGYKSLTELVNESRPGLAETNKGISTLLKAKEEVPSIYDIANTEKASLSGADAAQRAEAFLEKLPTNIATPLRDKISDLAIAKKVADKINAPSLSKKYLGEGPAALMYGGSNALGLAAKNTSEAGRAIGAEFYKMVPEQLASLGQAIGQKTGLAAQKVSTVLREAAQKDNFGRNALLFTLQQNPAYRQLIEETLASQNKAQ